MKTDSRHGRLAVTSIVRHAPPDEASGFLRVVDLADGRVLLKSTLPESPHRRTDPNPRGGVRGARGVAVDGSRLVVANAECLFIYDSSWKLVGSISNCWMGAIHDIFAEKEGIWVTCTNADLLLKVDWDGRILQRWEWRRDEKLRRAFGFGRLPCADRNFDYRDPRSRPPGVPNMVHLNAVTRSGDGLLLSFGRILSPRAYRRARLVGLGGRVAGLFGGRRRKAKLPRDPLSPGRAENADSSSAILLRRPRRNAEILHRVAGVAVPNHNALRVKDALLYNDSNRGALVMTGGDGGSRQRVVEIPGNPSFARGLAQVSEHAFLVGSQMPAAVYTVDMEKLRVTGCCRLDGAPYETVYGLCLLPDAFQDPPPRLEKAANRAVRVQ